jgi:heat-inducible transcriptional repressor
MVALTEAGFLRQPHTSAGREPTEEGYRYFVRQLMGQTDLAPQTKRMITHQFYQAGHDIDRWLRLAASILAHQSQAASLVTAPHPEKARFKHIELISTLGRQVLMVLVLTGGEIRQQMLALAEPVSQETLLLPLFLKWKLLNKMSSTSSLKRWIVPVRSWVEKFTATG